MGDSEAWKPQKVGGCRWNGCPRNSVLSHVAQDTARSWFWACLAQITHIQAIFGPFLGHIVELKGKKGLQGAIEAHVKCRNRLPSFACFGWVSGPFWAKKGCFGAQNAQFWEGTSRLGAPAPGRHR